MKPLNSERRRPGREYWRELISWQEQSGTTVRAFCAQQGVTDASFYGWRKKLRESAAVELVLATGERVQVGPGTDAATLRMVLAVLRERT